MHIFHVVVSTLQKEKGFKQQQKLDNSCGKYVPLASTVKLNVKKTGYVINENKY